MSAGRTQVRRNIQSAQTARSRRRHSRRQGWYALVISFCGLATIACLIAIMEFSTLAPFFTGAKSLEPISDLRQAHTGTIVLQRDDGRCEQKKFDNDTGKIVDMASAPCEDQVINDAHGVPIPQGTVRRLDTISRAFSGR